MTEAALEADHARSTLPSLTAFRWWAALVVFAFHLDAATGWLLVKPFGFGQAGVSFFFVLSGFVLTWATRGRPLVTRTFYRRRFARVYPAHLAVLLVVAALVVVLPGAPFEHSWLAAGLNVLLLQAWGGRDDLVFSFNGPAWSLSAEAFFYLLFPALLPRLRRSTPRRRTMWTAVLLLAALLVTVLLAVAGLGRTIAFPNPLVRLPEFVLGITMALQIQDGWKPRVRLPVAALVLLITAPLALVAPLFPLRDYVLLPASVLLIAAGVARDRTRGGGGRRVLVYLGELSFAFYLVHLVVLELLLAGPLEAAVWSPFEGLLPATLIFSLSLIGAVAVHHGVERPCQRLLARGITPRREAMRG